MGVRSKESHRLLDYQLRDFLELKLNTQNRKVISKIKREILKRSESGDQNLSEFSAVGTKNLCVVFPTDSTQLKYLCLADQNGFFKTIPI